MRILVACEFSGKVRDAFLERGHEAISVDLQPAIKGEYSSLHVQDDVSHWLELDWDLVIAHPPCTYLSNSGVVWLHRDESRWDKMLSGAVFFLQCLLANSPRVCVENPILHKYAYEIVGRPTQIVQPWMFGHKDNKATGLWLKGLPKLIPTSVTPEGERVSTNSHTSWHARTRSLPTGERRDARSITFDGLAQAMATQWG